MIIAHPSPATLHQQRGFTLLEVMLVLLLMGMVVGTVVMNIDLQDRQKQLEKQAQRFQAIVTMASDQAILTQTQYGLYVEENKYWFAKLDDEERWQPLEDDPLFGAVELDEAFTLEVQLDGLPWESDGNLFDTEVFDESLSVNDDSVQIGEEEDKPPPPPQVHISSSGDLTPFSLIFKYEPEFGSEQPVFFRVDAEESPPLKLSEPLDSL